ncbi:MAG: outer membrane beta-barrel protein [Candidatus Kapabacteria bacterium]|nr:outer membrane beta-barrel protein [Candidatus Kapabacteria bacterium]
MAYSPIFHPSLPTNTMCNNIFFIVMIIAVCMSGTLHAQINTKNELMMSAAAGISVNSIDSDRLPDYARRTGFGGTLSLFWQPEHLLSIGFETGWLFMNTIDKENVMTQFGATAVSSQWQAIPLLCVFGMKIHDNVSLYGGLGYYDIIAVNSSFGTKVATSQMNAGLSGGFDYHIHVYNKTALGMRLTLHNITELQQRLITLQFSYHYSLLAW